MSFLFLSLFSFRYYNKNRISNRFAYRITHEFTNCKPIVLLHAIVIPYTKSKERRKKHMNIGQRIQQARKGIDVKQEVFAKDLSVSKSCLSLYENEKRDISFPMFVDMLKTFSKYGQYHLVESILNEIKEEVWKHTSENEREHVKMAINYINHLVEKGYGKFKKLDDGAVGITFCHPILSRETEYFVKDFTNEKNEDIMVVLFHNELFTNIMVLQEAKTKKAISKQWFEEEIEKEDENYEKYNGKIPNEELFCFDRSMIERADIKQGLSHYHFSPSTIQEIQADFEVFYKKYQ